MIDFSYLLVTIAAGIGLIAGLLLGHMAKEELKPGKKQLELFQGTMLGFALFFFFFQFLSVLNAAASMVVLMFFIGKFRKHEIDYIVYLALGAVLFFSNNGYFALMASLIFLYSLPTGSLFVLRKACTSSVIYLSLIFMAIANILFLVFGQQLGCIVKP